MVVSCMTTLASKFGPEDQKGTILGIFRSLGALARAIGPIIASTGNFILIIVMRRLIKILQFITKVHIFL